MNRNIFCSMMSSAEFSPRAALWRFCLLLGAVLLLGGCSRAPEPITLSGSTMGTYWTVRLAALPADVAADDLRGGIEAVLEQVNAEMSTYRDDSVISAFNAAQAGETVDLPAGFAAVLSEALYWAEATGGAFDPTVGPLVDLWGFGPAGAIEVRPEPGVIARKKERVGWERVAKQSSPARIEQPGGIRLDLSGIAKGWGVDQVADYLQSTGVENFLIDIGGDLRVEGERPDGRGWRVAIERPQSGQRDVHSIIETRAAAIATSGDYRNFIELDGRHFSHLINPVTGYPIDHETVSVTVASPTCTTADALATALHIMPLEAAWSFAIDRNLAVFWLSVQDDEVIERATPGFLRLLETGAL